MLAVVVVVVVVELLCNEMRQKEDGPCDLPVSFGSSFVMRQRDRVGIGFFLERVACWQIICCCRYRYRYR